jgi:hypothetical protein
MTPNALFPGRAAIFLLANDDDRLDGRAVRFVERDQRILARHQQPAVAPGSPAGAGAAVSGARALSPF